MRTIEVKVYEFSELSEKAKAKAHDKWNENNNYCWGDDAIKSLQKFAEHFNCTLSDYSIDWLEKYRNEVSFDVPEYMQDIPEKELKSLILSMGSFNPDTL